MLAFLCLDYANLRRVLVDDLVSRMHETGRLLQVALRTSRRPADAPAIVREFCGRMKDHGRPGHILAVVDAHGKVIADGMGNAAKLPLLRDPALADVLAGKRASVRMLGSFEGQNIVMTAISLDGGPRRTPTGAIVLAESLADVNRLAYVLIARRVGLTICVVVAAVFATMWVVRRLVMRPVDALMAHVGALARGELSPRQHPDTSNELSELHGVFNRMVEKLRALEKELLDVERYATHTETTLKAYQEIVTPARHIAQEAETLLREQQSCPPKVALLLRHIHSEGKRIEKILNRLAFEDPGAADMDEVMRLAVVPAGADSP